LELVGITLLLVASAFFSGTETALYRSNWIRLTNWAEHGRAGARTALAVIGHQDRTVITILIGNNLVNNFISILISRFFVLAVGPAMTPVAVAIAVVATFIFGEYLPKSLARAFPNPWLCRAALPIELLRYGFYPFVMLFCYAGRVFAPKRSHQRLTLTREDYIAAFTHRGGPAQRNAQLAARLFRFTQMKVGEIQIPLATVRSVSSDSGTNEVMAVTRQHGFSRLPVYSGTPDNITGVLVVKDLLSAPTRRIRRISRVSRDARALAVLRQMQRRGEHLAVVVDEADKVTGIVSLEDLLEELVGEIRSEG
jgi:CBS domain containing-hemolysin-like protein